MISFTRREIDQKIYFTLFSKGDIIWVAGGNIGRRSISEVEIITLNGENKECDKENEEGNLPYWLHFHASVASSKGVITCGGKNGITFSNCILQTSNGYTSFPSMVDGRYGFGMANVEGIIYAIGGWLSSDMMETINVETGRKWKKESLPFNVFRHCVVYINMTIIVIGGYDERAREVS